MCTVVIVDLYSMSVSQCGRRRGRRGGGGGEEEEGEESNAGHNRGKESKILSFISIRMISLR